MSYEVASITAQLIAQTDEYERRFQAATARVKEHRQALNDLGKTDASTEATSASTSAARSRRVSAEASEARTATAAVKAAAKEKADAERVAAKAAADAIRTTERQKQAELKATQREQEKATRAAEKAAAADRAAADAAVAAVNKEAAARERLATVVERGMTRTRITPGTGARLGTTGEPGDRATAARQTEAMRQTRVASSPTVPVATREVDYARADLFDLNQKSRVASAVDRAALQDEADYLRRINAYRAAGLSETEALARADREVVLIEEQRLRRTAEQTALLEKQMRAQSGKVADRITLFAPALVGGVTVHELSELNDRYIELSNTLRVAGVSSAALDQVQGHLLKTANRSGTDINALADVYRGAALASHDLGASQADLLKITDAAANALRIQGRSSSEARGALLQLSHAFESGRVTSREFNSLSLNLYPILQAVAKGSDEFGGSVAKLRQKLLDTGISSKEFFQALIRGSDDLAARANAATLTTAQGFNALRNSLVVYFGEADKAQGVSAALGTALQTLASNLDSVIPAIAAIATALSVGYVTRLAAAAAATEGMGAAILAAFGGPTGIAITAVTLAVGSFAVAANDANQRVRQADQAYADLQERLHATTTNAHTAADGVAGIGTDALGAIPHVNAFAGAVGNLAQQLYNQARAARAARLEGLQQQLTSGQAKEVQLAGDTPAGRAGIRASNRAALSRGDILAVDPSPALGSIRSFFSRGRTDREAERGYAEQVRVDRDLQRQIQQARTAPITAADIPGGAPTVGGISAKADARLRKLETEIADLRKIESGTTGKRRASIDRQITRREQQVQALQAGASPGAASAGAYVPGSRGGPSADTLAHRAEAARVAGVKHEEEYTSALRQARDQQLEAQIALTGDTQKSAELERQRVRDAAEDLAKNIRAKGPKAAGGTGEYSAGEVSTLLGLNTSVRDLRIEGIDQNQRRQAAQDSASLDRADRDTRKAELQQRQQLADTTSERRRLAKELLDLEYQQREADLRATLAPDSKATPTERTIADRQLKALPGEKATEDKGIDRQYEGAGATYLRGLNNFDRGDFVQGEEIKALNEFNAGLDDSVKKALHLHGIFGDILSDLLDMAIKQALIKPLAGALFGGGDAAGGSGLGGLFSSVIGAVTGKSSSPSAAADAAAAFSLPGFASGGAIRIGGNAGVDRNVLSLNGTAVARVAMGETLGIIPNSPVAMRQGGGGDRHFHIAVDARNSVTPAGFAQELSTNILSQAAAMDRQAAGATLRATPGMIQKVQRLGTI